MTEATRSLFKYVSSERVDILEAERIAFPPPQQFNDPFDCHPTFAAIRSRAGLRRFVKEFGADFPPSVRKELSQHIRNNREEIAGSMQAQVLNQIYLRTGVFCLTTIKDNLVMWAHYAASHRGLVLEFKTSSPAFRELGRPHPISYSDQRPVCDADKRGDLTWFLRKSTAWRYEDEWRIVRELRFCECINTGSKSVYLVRLPKDAIKAVYLGVNTEQAIRDRVRSSIKGSEIELFSSRLSRTQFGLEFERA